MMLAVAACKGTIDIDGPGVGTPTIEERTVTLTATAEGSQTKTSLNGHAVVWDADDAIRVKGVSSDTGTATLTATVNATSQGIGIKISQTNGTAYVKYDNIKVVIDGKDVTSSICTNSGNSEKLGIYTPQKDYRYAPAGTVVEAEINNKGVIPLVQSSSSSKFSNSKTATVTLSGIQYSFDQISWTPVTTGTTLANGSEWGKNKLAYSLEGEDATDLRMTLSSGAGTPRGEFSALTSQASNFDNSVRAVFPYDALQSYDKSGLTLTVPATQTYVPNSFDHDANMMVGSVEYEESRPGVVFKHMMGVLELSLTGDCALSTITVTDKSGKKLCGSATISADSYESGINCDMISGGSSTVTLDCGGVVLSDSPVTFDIVVPVGAFENGISVTATSSDGTSQTLTSSGTANRIARADIKKMPQIRLSKMSQTVNLQNDALDKFMSYGTYSYFGAPSFFSTHSSELNSSTCTDQDRPRTLTVTWDGKYSNCTATLTDNTAGRTIFSNRTVSGNSYEFENMVPGRSYSYEIKAGGNTIKEGHFRTSGQVRMVNITDSWNWRDLGGWQSSLGGSVQYEWLYRGGSLNGVWNSKVTASTNTVGIASNYAFSATATQQVIDMGIKAELDLRGKTGDGQAWSQESGIHSRSIEQTHMPISDDNFKQIMTDQGLQNPLHVSSVVEDVKWIIDQVVVKGNPVAFHCKSGADRTGAVGMIILSLLGVDPGDIARDYELTTMSHEKLILNGTSSFQTRLASDTVKGGYAFFCRGFSTLAPGGNSNASYQEKAYFYLNQYFSDMRIPAADLDAFICKLLGISSYTHPTWAK